MSFFKGARSGVSRATRLAKGSICGVRRCVSSMTAEGQQKVESPVQYRNSVGLI